MLRWSVPLYRKIRYLFAIESTLIASRTARISATEALSNVRIDVYLREFSYTRRSMT
jgi:hypothetical protein